MIGCGIVGPTLALALTRVAGTGVEHVKIFEKRTELDIGQGGALNINGGASVLARLGLEEKLREIGNPMKRVLARTVKGGELYDVDVEDVFQKSDGGKDMFGEDGKLLAMTVMRDDLQRMLVEELGGNVKLERGARVEKIVTGGNGKEIVRLDNGTQEEFDLVVGCDGIRSKVREAVVGRYDDPVYSGIRVQFSVAPPGSVAMSVDRRINQWFGDGLYALCYTAGAGDQAQNLIALCFRSKSATDENPEYVENDVKQDCRRRLEQGNMPKEVMNIFERCERFIDIGVYYHNTLPSWSSENGSKVLCGDAAHAMAPFLGQGANQGIQDAYALAKQVSLIGEKHENLQQALKNYERLRKPPTSAIMQTSKVVGFLETQGGVGQVVRNSLLRSMHAIGLVGKAFVNAALPRVLD